MTDLGRELPQPSGNREALLEQYIVEGGAAERLQIHLMFIIPELIQSVCRQKSQNTTVDIKNSDRLPGLLTDWQLQI